MPDALRQFLKTEGCENQAENADKKGNTRYQLPGLSAIGIKGIWLLKQVPDIQAQGGHLQFENKKN